MAYVEMMNVIITNKALKMGGGHLWPVAEKSPNDSYHKFAPRIK